MKLSAAQKAIIALCICNTIWGIGSPIYKWVLFDIHPFTLALFRFYLPLLILLPFVYKNLKIERKDWKTLFLTGFLGIGINISFFFLGLTKTESINAPIIASAAPIFVILGSLFFFKEKVKIKTIFGTFVGFCGILLIILEPLLLKGLDSSVSGNLLLFVSMLGATGSVLFGHKICQKYPPAVVAFYSFLIGSLCFLPFSYSEIIRYGLVEQLTNRAIFGILFGAFFSSLAAYFFFYWGLKRISASEAGLFTYIDPITAIIIAIPLLGEKPTLLYMVGAVLVFVGIYIAERRIHYHPLHLLKKVRPTP